MDVNRVIYERQGSLGLRIPIDATVVGCGGTGWWVALLLTLAGCRTVYLIDPDRIESHNLNRLPVPPVAVGEYKATVLAEWLQTLRPDATIVAYPRRYHNSLLHVPVSTLTGGSLVYDCTDRFEVQQAIAQDCAEMGFPYLRVGCDADTVTVQQDINTWGEAPDGYTVIPMWVGPAVLAAVLGVGHRVNQWPLVSGPITRVCAETLTSEEE